MTGSLPRAWRVTGLIWSDGQALLEWSAPGCSPIPVEQVAGQG